MPIIDVTFQKGLFSESQRQQMAAELTDCLLQCDVTRDNPKARNINWCYLREIDSSKIFIGGAAGTHPHHRIDVYIMQGAMSDEIKSQVVESMTKVMIELEGQRVNPLNASRVWVLIHEVDEGNWGAGGKIYRLPELLDFLK